MLRLLPWKSLKINLFWYPLLLITWPISSVRINIRFGSSTQPIPFLSFSPFSSFFFCFLFIRFLQFFNVFFSNFLFSFSLLPFPIYQSILSDNITCVLMLNFFGIFFLMFPKFLRIEFLVFTNFLKNSGDFSLIF